MRSRICTESVLAGILLAIVANLMFATSDAITKSLTARYSVSQIILMEALFAAMPIGLMILRDGGASALRVRHPLLVALRGLLAGIGTIFGYFAFARLPLADVYAIGFCTPIMVTLLSIPVLGESVGIHRWVSVIVGFVGVMIMVRPGFDALSLGHAAAAINMLVGAGVVLIMRRIGRDERHSVIVAAVLIGLILPSLPFALVTFRSPNSGDLALAAMAGLAASAAQLLLVRALTLAPAAAIAPMEYSILIWGLVYGVLLFGDSTRPSVFAGASLVVASSLYILHREHRHGRRLRAHVERV